MVRYIEPFYFFIALFVGLFFTYISVPTPDIIIKYPTPENIDKTVYQDSADVCYQYEATEVQCPMDKSKIKKIKIQHKNDKGMLSNFNKLWN